MLQAQLAQARLVAVPRTALEHLYARAAASGGAGAAGAAQRPAGCSFSERLEAKLLPLRRRVRACSLPPLLPRPRCPPHPMQFAALPCGEPAFLHLVSALASGAPARKLLYQRKAPPPAGEQGARA